MIAEGGCSNMSIGWSGKLQQDKSALENYFGIGKEEVYRGAWLSL
jgi:hypothetical protein